jgi:LPS-assembly lipoprotein
MRGAPIVALALFCGACGWRPLYAPVSTADAGPVQRNLAAINVAPMPERNGQLLRLALQQRFERFGIAEPQKYDLAVSFGIAGDGIAIQPDNSVTFTRLTGTASWTLLAQTPQRTTLASGTARDIDGLNVIDQQYFAADLQGQVVQQRIADNIADSIAQQLAAYFERQRQSLAAE